MLAIDTTPVRRPRQLPAFLVAATLTAAACAGGVLVAANATTSKIQRVQRVAAALDDANATVDNYLMIGSDSRADGDPNTGQTGEVTGNRSDTIMIMRVDKASGEASLLSIPRDLWVTVPGREGQRKINAAFNDGPEVLVRAIQENLGIPVHHYVEIDFSGFKELVDALDGVEVCFFFPTRDFNTGLNITEPGCYRLDGTQALAYARSRYYEEFRDGEWRTDPTSDLGRIRRQQAFVNAALTGALARVKVDPFAAGKISDAIVGAIAIDSDLDPLQAAGSLRSAAAGGLQPYSLPVRGDTIDGQSVLLLADGAEAVLDYFAGRGPPPAGAAP